MAKEQLTAAPSDTFTKQNIENFQNCNTFKEDVNNQCKKKQFITCKATSGARSKAKLDHQLKVIRQQYHTVFHATKQQLAQSDKSKKTRPIINGENTPCPLPLSVIPLYLVLRKQYIASMEKR